MLFGGSTKGIKFNTQGLVPAIIQDADNKRVLMYIYMNKEAVQRSRKSGELWLYHRNMKKVWRKGNHSGNSMKVVDMMLHHDGNVILVEVIPNGPACHTGNETCFYHSYLQEPDKKPEASEEELSVGDGLEALRNLFEKQDLAAEVEVVTSDQSTSQTETNDLPAEPPEKVTASDSLRSASDLDFLGQIYTSIKRKIGGDIKNSYTAKMAKLGGAQIAQKVGENAMQLVYSATQNDVSSIVKKEAEIILNLLILLAEKQIELEALKIELGKRAL